MKDEFNIWNHLVPIIIVSTIVGVCVQMHTYRKSYQEGYVNGYQARIDYEHGG